jgi:hypothetical protein
MNGVRDILFLRILIFNFCRFDFKVVWNKEVTFTPSIQKAKYSSINPIVIFFNLSICVKITSVLVKYLNFNHKGIFTFF